MAVLEKGSHVDKVLSLDELRGLVATAGAYGFVMGSQYNSRPRPPEVIVHGKKWTVVRDRETLEDLVRGEHIPTDL